MKKVITVEKAVEMINDGTTLMIGGFATIGKPETIINAMCQKGVKGLTVIANDSGRPEEDIGKLIVNHQISRILATHVGTNPETGRQVMNKELELELVPQGTMAERIRAGGSGLGGVLTPTGVGTLVAEGKQIIKVDEREFLLEKPIRAEIAIIKAHKADEKGNLIFRRAARNFNTVMATAADIVIAEVDEMVPVGTIDPDEVMVPGNFIDYIVKE